MITSPIAKLRSQELTKNPGKAFATCWGVKARLTRAAAMEDEETIFMLAKDQKMKSVRKVVFQGQRQAPKTTQEELVCSKRLPNLCRSLRVCFLRNDNLKIETGSAQDPKAQFNRYLCYCPERILGTHFYLGSYASKRKEQNILLPCVLDFLLGPHSTCMRTRLEQLQSVQIRCTTVASAPLWPLLWLRHC